MAREKSVAMRISIEATGDVVGVPLFSDPATAQHPQGRFDVFPAVAVAVFFGQRERCPIAWPRGMMVTL